MGQGQARTNDISEVGGMDSQSFHASPPLLYLRIYILSIYIIIKDLDRAIEETP
jgi:hypothetical protein